MLSSPRKCIQPVYIKKLSDQIKKEVMSYFYDEEISYSLPDMKYTGLYFMHVTLLKAYNDHYMVKCKDERKISFKSFCHLKPSNVHTIQQIPLRGCKCDICLNIGIIREKLIGLGVRGIPRNHACLIEVTWCPFRKKRAFVPNSQFS